MREIGRAGRAIGIDRSGAIHIDIAARARRGIDRGIGRNGAIHIDIDVVDDVNARQPLACVKVAAQ